MIVTRKNLMAGLGRLINRALGRVEGVGQSASNPAESAADTRFQEFLALCCDIPERERTQLCDCETRCLGVGAGEGSGKIGQARGEQFSGLKRCKDHDADLALAHLIESSEAFCREHGLRPWFEFVPTFKLSLDDDAAAGPKQWARA